MNWTYAYLLNDSRPCYSGNQLEEYDIFCQKDCIVLKTFRQYTPTGKMNTCKKKRDLNEKTFKSLSLSKKKNHSVWVSYGNFSDRDLITMTSLSTCISKSLEISMLRLLLERNILSASLSETSRVRTKLNAFFKNWYFPRKNYSHLYKALQWDIYQYCTLHAHPHAVNDEKE